MKPELLPTEPQPIAPDTWLIPTLALDPMSGAYFGAHSMVIRGAEPVIVDTGASLVREHWMQSVFSVVEPEDVRWVYVSHDDHDHIGNLLDVLDRCPQATLIASAPIVNRLFGDVELPLERMRWLNEGESLVLSDRTLRAVRPPMFDAPSTRALYDGATGVLWAVDSFAALFPGAVYDADDVPAEIFDLSFTMMNYGNTPWLEWADPDRYAAMVAHSRSLGATTIASSHGPVLRGARIDDAYERTLHLVGAPAIVPPSHDVLEMFLAAMLAPTA
jgi:flavorubredoxin